MLATSSLTTVQAAVGTGMSRFYRVNCRGPLTAPLTAFEPPQAPPAQPGGSGGCGAGAQDDSLPYLFSGEFHHTATDLMIKGRGMDFVWARKYRSKVGLNTAQGNGWDFSYNIRVAPNGADLDVSDGNGRTDKYRLQDNGTYGADQLFCEGALSNNVFTLKFPEGGIWQFRPLDGSAAAGKINTITDRNGNRLAFAYDALARFVQTVDNIGNTNRSGYDSRNNRTLAIDARGNVTRFDYDGLNRLTQTARQLTDSGLGSGTVVGAIVTRQTWDDSSRLTSQTDDNVNTTSYVYDSLNRPVTTVFADGTADSVTYDVHDNAVSRTDANGSVVTTTHDHLNRATGTTIARAAGVLGTSFENYQYDGLGRVWRAANDDAVVTRAYDSLGHVTTETQQVLPGGPVRTVACDYDNEGNQVSCTYPGGRTVDRTYDELDRTKVIADLLGGLADYSYYGPGRVQRRDNGNGTRVGYAYDGVRRALSTHHTRIAGGTVIDSRVYAWDPAHNKTAATDLLPLAQDARTYGYDSASRMVHSAVATVGPVIDYTLDGVGNRTLVAGGAQPGAYFLNPTVPPADSPMNQYTMTPFDARTYDANGNLLEAGAQRFTYDYRDRLIAAFRFNGVSLYTNTLTARYDCFGRRMEKAVPGATARYYYAGWQEIEEQDGANATVATYAWGGGIDELVEMTRNGQSYFYHADHLGSIRKVTDAAGNVVEQYRYGDYGDPRFFNAAGTALSGTQIGNSTLYTGRRFDTETGLYYYRTRYSESASGRFTTRDMIGVWGDPRSLGNGTAYAWSNPSSVTDPFGLTASGGGGLSGSDICCCGNYSGPCLYSHLACCLHDLACLCCDHWYCGWACKPELSCATITAGVKPSSGNGSGSVLTIANRVPLSRSDSGGMRSFRGNSGESQVGFGALRFDMVSGNPILGNPFTGGEPQNYWSCVTVHGRITYMVCCEYQRNAAGELYRVSCELRQANWTFGEW